MRQIVLCGIMAVLGLPFIATAQEQPVPSDAGYPAAQSPNPASEAVFQYVTGFLSDTTEANDSKYWIGLSCAPVDDALRSQLGIEAGTGLVIRQIADNSPASDAGLAVHDVIAELKFGGEAHQPGNIAQLTTWLQRAEGRPITFVLMRSGKPLNITVAPQERQVANPTQIAGPARSRRVNDEFNSRYFRMTGPIVTYPRAYPKATNLPDDLTVVITKSGSRPVEITVRQKDGGEWKLKEQESAGQPEHVSQAVTSVIAYLSQLTGRTEQQEGRPVFKLEPASQARYTTLVPSSPFGQEGTTASPGKPSNQPAGAFYYRGPATLHSLQQRLDEIQKQQEQLVKALDELRQSQQKSPPQN